MIDTYFERPSPLTTCVSFAPVTYVQTRQTSMFKGSLFGSLCTAYRDLTTQDITNGAWAMFVDLEQVISEHVTVLLTVDQILKC